MDLLTLKKLVIGGLGGLILAAGDKGKAGKQAEKHVTHLDSYPLQAQPLLLLHVELLGMQLSPQALLDVQTLQQSPLGSSSMGPQAVNIRPTSTTINMRILSSS